MKKPPLMSFQPFTAWQVLRHPGTAGPWWQFP